MDKNALTQGSGSVSLYARFDHGTGPFHVRIYNSAGELVRVLEDRRVFGETKAYWLWDGKNHFGDPCASGVYLIHFQTPIKAFTRKIILLK